MSSNASNTGTMLVNDPEGLRNRNSKNRVYTPVDEEEDVNLFNYIKRSSPNGSTASLGLEQVLASKLEEFISSTLRSLEEYFSDNADSNECTAVTSNGSTLSAGTVSSTHLHSNPRTINARLIYQSLTLLKGASKQKKLDILDRILDEYYGNVLEKCKITSSDEKLILGLEFIELKFKNFLNAKTNEMMSLASDNEKRGMVSQTFRDLDMQFHNYDNAIVCGSQRLLHYWELPFPWRENKFIVYGYRFHDSYLACVRSIFQIHNETGNIWTHILGFVLVMYLCFVHFPNSSVYENSSLTGIAYIYLFLLAAIKSLTSSVCWHTFNSTSKLVVRSRFACIDYTGITVLITLSVITTEYCSLYYYPLTRNIIIGFSVLMGLLGFYFTWSPQFDTPKARPFRIFFFISLAALGLLSFSILGYYQGWMNSVMFYFPIWKSLACYLLGVLFYGFLFPECCRGDVIIDSFDLCDEILNELNDHDDLSTHFKVPNKTDKHEYFTSLWWIDYCFSSHNIWHLFVVGGILFHYAAILQMFGNIVNNAPAL